MSEKNKITRGTLYLVATPIGNLDDISARALKVLAGVDFVAAEDTRNSLRLLSHFEIKKPLLSYHEHNKKTAGEEIAARLLQGESCALVTDAGMPAISDPGEELVRLCAERRIPVTCIPGCCAAVTALSLSALPTARFAFEGFLPVEKAERRVRLSVLAEESRTVILYEAPHKLKRTLEDLSAVLSPDREIALCRELTKLNEEIVRTTLSGALALYSDKEPRGEYVLILAGGEPKKQESPLNDLPPEAHVAHYEKAGLPRMDAIKAAAKDRGISKSILYKQLQ